MIRKTSLAILLLCAWIGLPMATGPAAAQQVAPGQTTPDPVVATVDGVDIHLSRLKSLHAAHPDASAFPLDDVFDQILQMAIDAALIDKAVARDNLRDDEAVKKRLAEAEADLLRRIWMERQVAGSVTDDALQSRYRQMAVKMPPETLLEVRQILVETRSQAMSLIDRLKGGEDFVDLAKRFSIGRSARDGGYIGYVARKDVPDAFAEVAFALDDGAFSTEPAKTTMGWHVIKVESRRSLDTPSFPDVRGDLEFELTQQAVEGVVQDLRDRSTVKTFGRGGRKP